MDAKDAGIMVGQWGP